MTVSMWSVVDVIQALPLFLALGVSSNLAFIYAAHVISVGLAFADTSSRVGAALVCAGSALLLLVDVLVLIATAAALPGSTLESWQTM